MSAQTKIAAEASVREAEATVKLADEARRYESLDGDELSLMRTRAVGVSGET